GLGDGGRLGRCTDCFLLGQGAANQQTRQRFGVTRADCSTITEYSMPGRGLVMLPLAIPYLVRVFTQSTEAHFHHWQMLGRVRHLIDTAWLACTGQCRFPLDCTHAANRETTRRSCVSQ